ncbi:GNAT family N-acetyltransferase [Zoogloea sp.]|mgnify:FL=1|jgi:hypothetical protein|uniref:GNAT family N-acetyltransferase n=1 Tax=Zoogloea sp. TaxID=49181 RepID=UPI001B4E0B81|nr:GNAT family N-acetyltransferase [Zoogloea sp.]MBK6653161.1 GNAT family N-acetyltransferase [Zoogloea sp.]MBK7848014.1 GNAT family N-acetyltransferase [Zoogloea sp.]MBP7443316.1 GNAT family N-acetyltransferase [Zoogloea sp.]
MQILLLDNFEDIGKHLSASSSGHEVNDVFLTQEWFANLAATGFDSAARPRLWAFEQDGRIVGCVPMADGFRSDAPMGTTLASLSNYYSCLYGPIVPGKALPAQAWATLARAIRQHPDHWPVIDFHPLDTESDFFSGMLAGLKAEGYWTDTLFCFGNWFFEVEGRDYSQYLASRTSKLRSNISRARKKLDTTCSWNIEVVTDEGPALETAIAEFERVYNLSWKQPEPYPEFIPSLCRLAARQGWLRLGLLNVEGQTIAAQLWFVVNGRALIYKIAYDQAHAALSAGAVLTADMIRRVIDGDKVQEVDYLSGDDSYKRHWMSRRRERFGIIAFNPRTIGGFIAGSKHFLGKRIKHLRSRLEARFRPATASAAD